jgi:aminopeptidase N
MKGIAVVRTACTLVFFALGLLAPAGGPALASDPTPLQPEGREGLGPDRNYDITKLILELSLDLERGRVEGAATHRLTLLGKPTKELAFHQTGLDVSAVTVDGTSTAFRLTDTWLFVTLPSSVGESSAAAGLEVRIEYSAEPTVGLHFRRPGKTSPDLYAEVWSQGENSDNRHWFPTWDHPSDRFEYEGIFTADSKLTVVSNGELVRRSDGQRGRSTWHYRLEGADLVSYLVMVAAGPYERYVDRWGDREVSYYVPPGTGEDITRLGLGETVSILDFFSEITGVPYPYSDYKQVFVQRFIYSGMENTTATVMEAGLLHEPRVHEHTADWTEGVVAHELAHQWYGDQLTCAIWREMWLNEGFASFFTNLWMSESRGMEHAAAATLRTYASVRLEDKSKAKPLVTRFWNSDGDGRANPYSKGSSVLQMLRVYLGDTVFFAGIRKYTQDNQHSSVETEDLRRAFEAVSGERLDWFFDQWVFLAGHPKLKVSHKTDSEEGRLIVSLRQVQKIEGATPRFILPIDLEIATTEGRRIERVWLEDGEASIKLDLEGDLLWLGFDPQAGLLAEIEQQQSPDEWLAQLADSEYPVARLRAIDALNERKGPPTEAMRSQLVALAQDSEAAGVLRIRAISAIGAWRDDRAADRLLALLGSEREGSAKLRDEVVEQLGNGLVRKDVIVALDRALLKDSSLHVRAQALESLADLLGPGARGRAKTALKGRRTYRDIVERSAVSVLGRVGTLADLASLALLRRPTTRRHLLHGALWASVRLAGKADLGEARKAARLPIARDAERLLRDLNLRTRQTAVSVLGSVGDRRSIQELRALTKRENYAPLAESAESAVQSIRERDDRAHDPTPAAVEARLKKLEERIDAAEGELKRLEERR